MPASSLDEIGPVLGRIASGVFILTAGDGGGQETGMLASWVQQASFDPPQITVAVNRARYLNEWVGEGSPVVLNIVGENEAQFLKHFGKGFEPGEEAFSDLQITRSESGGAILGEALGYLAGTVRAQLAAGDHEVYLIEITEAGQGPAFDSDRPMVHIRKNGLSY